MSPDGSLWSCDVPIKRIRVDRGAVLHRVGGEVPSPGMGLVFASRSATVDVEEGFGSFWLVLRGSAHVSAREGRFLLRPGAWLALGRESHPTVIVDRTALVLSLLVPMPAASPYAAEGNGLPRLYPGRGHLDPRARRGALQLWRDTWSASRGADALLPRFGHFLSTVQADVSKLLAQCPGRTQSRRQQVLARMQRAVLYLDGYHDRTVRIEELARLTSFSQRHFTKTFGQVYSCVPREMTNHLRLRAAADLLTTTALSVGEVGSRCGYQNACSFSRAFRDFHGVPASLYRRSNAMTPMRVMQSLLAFDATRSPSNR